MTVEPAPDVSTPMRPHAERSCRLPCRQRAHSRHLVEWRLLPLSLPLAYSPVASVGRLITDRAQSRLAL
jgi:hypothetical protein